MRSCNRLAVLLLCLMSPTQTAWRAGAAEVSVEAADLALQSAKPPFGGLCIYAAPSSSNGLKRLADGCGLYVQGLVSDRERAERFRKEIESHAAASRLSVALRRTAHLPYLDDLINLFVAEGWGQGELAGTTLAEV